MKKLDVFYNIMKKNITFLLIFLLSVLLQASEVVIWATTDMHGILQSKRGGMAGILSILELKRKPQDILLDAGDLFQGSYIANSTNGSVIVNAFNLMNYDFYVPGNHEFEFGSEVLRKNFEAMNSVILCANWAFVPAISKMKPFCIIERNKMRIAIIGVGERESRNRILPDKKLVFMNEEKSIALALKELRKEKVDLTILVRHGGIYFKGGSLFSLLKKFPEIDLVIGGHSHQLEIGRKIAGAYYVQPGMLAQGVSEIRVKFNDRSRKIERITSFYHNAADFEPSAKMKKLLSMQRKIMKDAYRTIPDALPENVKSKTAAQSYLTLKCAAETAPADAHLFFIEKAEVNWNGRLNKYLIHRFFPYENALVTIPVSSQEYQIMLNEVRRYSDKYKVKFIAKAPRKQYFLLQTTAFVLSGGGANFPESRKIAEQKHKQIKIYPSMRQCVADFLNLK
ncbi:MAG: bifunctional metallophosphatase/5'-nucleotidase [Lentisphaeria bacterium]|nr:bifunctional metallophosphatase/5'-nucleotidase [Lentisphaeria bacterium]